MKIAVICSHSHTLYWYRLELLQEFIKNGQRGFENRSPCGGIDCLIEASDPASLSNGNAPRVVGFNTAKDLQKGRFPAAVDPHQADGIVLFDLKTDIREQRSDAETFRKSFASQQCHDFTSRKYYHSGM